MARDYYVVLGVPPHESALGIRAAYRELVKRHHPDRAGAVGTARFREVNEAYGVLSDSTRRRDYDASRERRDPTASGRWTTAAWPPPEPLAPEASALSEFGTVRPSLDEVLAGLRRAATGERSPKGGHAETLHVELPVGRDDVLRGGAIRLAVPVPGWCAACGGSGYDGFGRCRACGGDGVVERETVVRVPLPPAARDAMYEVSLEPVGLRDVVLRLHLRVVGRP